MKQYLSIIVSITAIVEGIFSLFISTVKSLAVINLYDSLLINKQLN
jgi:hypothetical protein